MRPPAAALLLAGVLAATAGLPTDARGQGPDEDLLRGRVVLEPDSAAVAGRTVVLHRITPDTGMAVDSVTTDADGRFSFRLPAGSRDVFVASARHAGILYFGPAVDGGSPPDAYRLTVYDVREAGPADTLRLASRALVVTPGASGVEVTDVVQVAGIADRTLVGRAPVAGAAEREPWWSLRLPTGVRDVRVLAGGVGERQVELLDGEARLSAPVPPTGARVVLSYRVPSGAQARLRLARPVGHLEVVVRQDVSGMSVDGLSDGEEIASGEGRYRRYAAREVEAGREVRIAVADADGPGVPRETWIAAGLGVLLLAGAAVARWVARRPPGA